MVFKLSTVFFTTIFIAITSVSALQLQDGQGVDVGNCPGGNHGCAPDGMWPQGRDCSDFVWEVNIY